MQPIYRDEDLDITPTERETVTVRASPPRLRRAYARVARVAVTLSTTHPLPVTHNHNNDAPRARRSQIRDKIAYGLVSAARYFFDIGTGYGPNMTEAKWLNRFVFLETVAAIPGMVGGAIRHLHSLRLMKRDNGWIHTLLEEAENERMHLLTFIQLKQPGIVFRGAVLVAQGVLYNLFFASYLLSPKTVHRFVGHLEEQAVKTYTHAIEDIDAGKLPQWTNMPAPEIAMNYWYACACDVDVTLPVLTPLLSAGS